MLSQRPFSPADTSCGAPRFFPQGFLLRTRSAARELRKRTLASRFLRAGACCAPPGSGGALGLHEEDMLRSLALGEDMLTTALDALAAARRNVASAEGRSLYLEARPIGKEMFLRPLAGHGYALQAGRGGTIWRGACVMRC